MSDFDLEGMKEEGIKFGYPICCVNAFTHDLALGRSPGQQRGYGPWTGSGFIPCPSCAAKIEVEGMQDFVRGRIMPMRMAGGNFPRDSHPLVGEWEEFAATL